MADVLWSAKKKGGGVNCCAAGINALNPGCSSSTSVGNVARGNNVHVMARATNLQEAKLVKLQDTSHSTYIGHLAFPNGVPSRHPLVCLGASSRVLA